MKLRVRPGLNLGQGCQMAVVTAELLKTGSVKIYLGPSIPTMYQQNQR
jgi:DNA-binding helix-hairpin-helix protein with protein kinase domain